MNYFTPMNINSTPSETERPAGGTVGQNNNNMDILNTACDIQSFINNYAGDGGGVGGDTSSDNPALSSKNNNVNNNNSYGLYDSQSSQKINNGSRGMMMSGEADMIAQDAMPIKGGNGMEESDYNNNKSTTPNNYADAASCSSLLSNGGGSTSGSAAPITSSSSNNNTEVAAAAASGTTNNNKEPTQKASPPTTTTTMHREQNIFQGKGSFPLNLTVMLESVERMKLDHIIEWSKDGTTFCIHDPDLFLSDVLPKFFKTSKTMKIRSFYRKLNRWGFNILRGGNQHQEVTAESLLLEGSVVNSSSKGVWRHPNFYRARAVACLKMAMETGDTTCFLDVVHGPSSDHGYGGGGKAKRRSSKRKSESSSCTDITGTDSPSPYFGQVSGGGFGGILEDDPMLIANLNFDGISFPQNVGATSAAQQVAAAAAAQQQAQAQAAATMSSMMNSASLGNNPYGGGGLSNSFTAGMNHQAQQQQPTPVSLSNSFTAGQAAAMQGSIQDSTPIDAALRMFNNKRGRHGNNNLVSQSFTSGSNHFYQPQSTSSSALQMGNNRSLRQQQANNMLSASWTAGFSNPLAHQQSTMQGQQQEHLQQLMMQQQHMLQQQQNQMAQLQRQQQQQQQNQMTQQQQSASQQTTSEEGNSNDAELAKFLSQFADSMQNNS